MKAKKIKLCYTEEETAVLLRSLINLKNNLIRQGRYADIVDEVILLLVDGGYDRQGAGLLQKASKRDRTLNLPPRGKSAHRTGCVPGPVFPLPLSTPHPLSTGCTG